MTLYLSYDGELEPAAFDLLRSRGVRLSEAEIRRVFDPSNLHNEYHRRREERQEQAQWRRWQAQWREWIVDAMVRENLGGAVPARIDRSGNIVFTGTPTDGFFATQDHTRMTFVNRQLGTIMDTLLALNAVPLATEHFQLEAGSGGNVRDWSVVRFLAFACRLGNDPRLIEAYTRTHVSYLTAKYSDPFKMVQDSDIESCGLARQQMSFRQFWGLSDLRQPANFRNSLRRGLWVPEPVLIGAREWFRFLCVPSAWIGDPASSDRRLLGCLSNRRDGCRQALPGVAMLANKQPDIVTVKLDEEEVEVIDATLRIGTRWHTFKTAMYASVLQAIFSKTGSRWVVTSLDFRDRRTMNSLY